MESKNTPHTDIETHTTEDKKRKKEKGGWEENEVINRSYKYTTQLHGLVTLPARERNWIFLRIMCGVMAGVLVFLCTKSDGDKNENNSYYHSVQNFL